MIWSDVAMEFVEGLPLVNNKTVILTVVDWLSKAAHFIPLGHPYTAITVVRAFFNEIVWLHSVPASIVGDRNPVFYKYSRAPSFFLCNIHEHPLVGARLSRIKLQMSSTFHPQSDGQSEVANKVIVMYLQCLTSDRPKSGCGGCHGQSTASTWPSVRRSALLRSIWSMAGIRHP
jgi:hypothetical protein